MEDDEQQREGRERGGDPEDPEHSCVHASPAKRGNVAHGNRHATRAPPRWETCQTSQRAMALTISVMTNSTNPTARSDDSCRPSESLNLSAINDAIVLAGALREAE